MKLFNKLYFFNLFYLLFFNLFLVGCSYLGNFSISNYSNYEITVEIQLNIKNINYLFNKELNHSFEVCPIINNKIDCNESNTIIKLINLPKKSNGSYYINIPPKTSLIIEKTYNFFGFYDKEDVGELKLLTSFDKLSIITNDGIVMFSGIEIIKAFKLKKDLWWDIEVKELINN